MLSSSYSPAVLPDAVRECINQTLPIHFHSFLNSSSGNLSKGPRLYHKHLLGLIQKVDTAKEATHTPIETDQT